MKTTNLITFSLLLIAGFVLSTNGQSAAKNTGEEFRAFLVRVDAAQLELQNGKAEPFKAVWSRGEDVTLSGGFGGSVEKGWDAVSKRLDWVGSSFSKGTNKIERVVTNQHGDLGYVVQLEHIAFSVPDTGKPATRDYRVTMIFRKEKGGWKIVHRQADSNLTKQAPQ